MSKLAQEYENVWNGFISRINYLYLSLLHTSSSKC